MRTKWAMGVVVGAGLMVMVAVNAFAHCDTTSGPVIPEARAALEKGDERRSP